MKWRTHWQAAKAFSSSKRALVALADIPLGVGSSHSNFINLGVLDT
jgi:hypothetical protein